MLFVDPRIGSEDLLTPLQRYGVPAVMHPVNMPAGDFAFIGRGLQDVDYYIGVELKETRDIVSCLFSGRYTAEQVPKLQRQYDRVWLLTEGIWRAGDGGVLEVMNRGWKEVKIGTKRIMASDLDAWILTQSIRGGFHHHHCATRTDTIRFLATLYHWWTDKTLDEHRSHQAIYIQPPDRVQMVEPPMKLKMASCLPNVGWEKATALIDAGYHFALMGPDGQPATTRQLTDVDGVGKVIATKIVTALQEGR